MWKFDDDRATITRVREYTKKRYTQIKEQEAYRRQGDDFDIGFNKLMNWMDGYWIEHVASGLLDVKCGKRYQQMQISSGGHFVIQYGGHNEIITSGPISENVSNILLYISAKFGACITKCTIGQLSCPTVETSNTFKLIVIYSSP